MGDATDKVTEFFLKNAFPLLLAGKERPSLAVEGRRRRAAEALMAVFTSGPAHNSAHSCQEGRGAQVPQVGSQQTTRQSATHTTW